MRLNFEKIEIEHKEDLEKNLAIVEIKPLEIGYSEIMAVPLRNVMLSSMPGVAIIGARIADVTSEFSEIEGSIQDMTELIMNLKKIKFKTNLEGIQVLKFKASKEGYYTASDIELIEGVELATPDKELIALDGSKEVEIELFIKKDRGYIESTKHKDISNVEEYPNVIKIDGMFTPISEVGYHKKEIRVGQSGDYEKLVFKIKTDGSINPVEAVTLAAKITRHHFDFFEDMKEMVDEYELIKQEEIQEEHRLLDEKIEMMDLSVRSYNCLKNHNITYIKDLCDIDYKTLKSIEHLGKKSLEEILQKLESYGLSLSED